MLEIMFDASSHGTLKFARYLASCVLNDTQPDLEFGRTLSVEDISCIKQNMENVYPKCPVQVVTYDYALDRGNLTIPLEDIRRKRYAIRFLMDTVEYNYEDEGGIDDDYSCHAWENIKVCMDYGDDIRIWLSDDANSVCGFYDLCDRLKQYDGNVYIIKCPSDNTERPATWGLHESVELFELCQPKLLSKEEREAISNKWATLKAENSPLRALINDEIISVDEDYYDKYIWEAYEQTIAGNEKLTETVISCNAMVSAANDLKVAVYFDWFCKRVDDLIGEGKIIIVEDNEDKHKRVLKKAIDSD